MGYEELKIEGRNAVLEAFRSGKTIDKLFVLDGCQDGPVRTIVREAKKHDTIVHFVEKERLDQLSETKKHQGVIAVAAAYEYAEVEDMLKLAEEKGEPLPDKAVKLALDEIAAGKIVYRPGPRVETAIPQNNAIAAAMVDVDDTLDLDEDEEHTDSEADEDKDENADEVRRLNEFDDGSLSDGDIPEEDL